MFSLGWRHVRRWRGKSERGKQKTRRAWEARWQDERWVPIAIYRARRLMADAEKVSIMSLKGRICFDDGKAMFSSRAFSKLPATAMRVLLLFYCRRQFSKVGHKDKERTVISNNGKIMFPYAEARKQFNIGAKSFSKAIDKLIEVGFLDIKQAGGGMLGSPTLYAISERWRKFGASNFERAKRDKDTRGFGFTSDNWEEMTGRTRKHTSIQLDTAKSKTSVF